MFIQITYFQYRTYCEEALPKISMWLMIEVIIFYCYLFVECITGLSIFMIMLRKHNINIAEQQKQLKELDTSSKSPAKRQGRVIRPSMVVGVRKDDEENSAERVETDIKVAFEVTPQN